MGVSCPWIDCVLGSGALCVLTGRLSHPLELKLLISGYSKKIEYNRKKHMQHTVILCKQGRGLLVVVRHEFFFAEQRVQSFFLGPRLKSGFLFLMDS